MNSFGKYTFRNNRNGKVAVICAASQDEALAALTCYPHAWTFVSFAPLAGGG